MFNWVCPRCGKDVPPSRSECPNCGASEGDAAGASGTAPIPPAQVPSTPAQPQGWNQPAPPQGYPPPPHYGAPQHGHWPPPHRPGPPAWAMGLLFALAFIGLFAAVYFGIQHFSKTNPSEKAGLENPANPSREKVANPLQKYVEVVGIRLISDNRKPAARFLVVNHSTAEIADLNANVTLWASTSRSEEDSVGSFSFKLNSLGPNGSQEVTAPLKTRLKMYELPDWQNESAEIQIVSPQ